jgi:hypothetical protein
MGGKKIKGRKCHIVTDTVAGCYVFEEALKRYPTLAGVCADAGYRKTMEKFVKDILHRTIEISQRIMPGWAVLAKRWIVERTLAWLNSSRRPSKDYEIAIRSAENMVMISHSALLIKPLV